MCAIDDLIFLLLKPESFFFFNFLLYYIHFVSNLDIRSSFSQIDLPNSWIGALVLRQIKKDWAVPGKITFREIIHAQEILALNFKFFGKNLKRFVKLNEFIKLTLTCKASVSSNHQIL